VILSYERQKRSMLERDTSVMLAPEGARGNGSGASRKDIRLNTIYTLKSILRRSIRKDSSCCAHGSLARCRLKRLTVI